MQRDRLARTIRSRRVVAQTSALAGVDSLLSLFFPSGLFLVVRGAVGLCCLGASAF